MPISSAIKGLQSIKSMQNVAKSGIPNKENSVFIKLFMYEKERTRLKTEEINILQRLEIIQTRLNEIQKYNEEKVAHMHNPEPQESNQEKSGWKTMSMEY
jgi:hypothetical protein